MSGNPEYVEVRNEFYKESQALMIVYDVGARKSFDALDMWLREASKYGGESLPVWVVGNKSDIEGKRAVEKSTAAEWTKSRNFKGYFEVSAMSGISFIYILSYRKRHKRIIFGHCKQNSLISHRH